MSPGTRAGRPKRWAVAVVDQSRAGAEAIGTGVDKTGAWSMRMGRLAVRNPARTTAVTTALFVVIARVPTEIFYSGFGLRPGDVGLDSVEVLLQGSALLLFLFALTAVAFAALALLIAMAFAVPHAIMVGRLPRRGPKEGVRRSVVKAVLRVCRLAPIVVPLFTVLLVAYYFGTFTIEDLETVKSGSPLEELFVPWQAEPVELVWTGARRPAALPTSCRWLLYLGEDDGRVALYDVKHDDTYRVNSKDVELRFPILCPHGHERS